MLLNETTLRKTFKTIGLMSGTSLDGVDAALVTTDGVSVDNTGESLTLPYPADFREALRKLLAGDGDVVSIEKELTEYHAKAVKQLLAKAGLQASDIDLIGFHGQTILHRPEQHTTWQIGNASLLAKETGISVVNDFRRKDMAAGGQGAPLVPIYHAAITKHCEHPVAILNIGGVANVTWIGEGEGNMLAFDTGPGNALIDDWILQHTGQPCDENGAIAAKGIVHEDKVTTLLSHPYFATKPPKSLDRNSFSLKIVQGLSLEDGAATLTAFTVRTIAAAQQHFPEMPHSWYVCGGGRHNRTIMEMLQQRINASIQPVEALSINGDALEAQAFGFLAVRSVKGLPLTFPSTTGVMLPITGGVFCPA